MYATTRQPVSPPRPGRAPRSIQDVLDVFRRHRGRGLFTFAGVLALTAAALVVSPRTYQSEAKLFVRVGRESIGLDPTAITSPSISVSDSREFEMNSVMDLIDSRAVLERVVDAVGAERILTGRPARGPATASITPRPENAPGDTPLERDQAVRALADSIKTKSSKRSSVVSVSCRSASPELAQQLLQTFLDSFQSLHLQASRVDGSRTFFEEQCRLLEEQLRAATDELADAKSALGLASIEGRQKTLEDQVSQVRTALVRNAASLAASEATIAALTDALDRLPERRVMQEVTGFPDDADGAARKHLRELRLKEQDLLVRFTPQHPEVAGLRRQIESAERALQRPDPEVRQATTSSNPNREAIQLKLLGEEAAAAALRAEAETLEARSTELRSELHAINGRDAAVGRLQQRVDVLKAGHKGYVEKLEQARIDQALAAERISNVSVVQPATFGPKPVSPKKSLVLAAGFAVALLSAVGVVLGGEYLRPELLTMPLRGER